MYMSSASSLKFLSTPSGWRATGEDVATLMCLFNFYPRPPGGGRHCCREYGIYVSGISIHALRVEGDILLSFISHSNSISIHALRVEGDCEDYAGNFWQAMISIHALRVEGDRFLNHRLRG